jgi:hypothetical protein
MNKILFLDHDGVICLEKQWGSRFHNKNYDYDFDLLDKKAVKVLNKICENTNCKIVISSDWRLYEDLLTLAVHYKKNLLDFEPFDITPILFDKPKYRNYDGAHLRGTEIKRYLSKQKNNIDKWVAVDDLPLEPYLKNFVRTESKLGITKPGVYESICEYLK